MLLFLVYCHPVRKAHHGDEAVAVIEISNDWVEEGEDEVVLLEESTIRLAVSLREKKSTQISASATMERFALSFTESGRFIEFLAGIRPTHTYTIRCSPCCFFIIEDRDDDPYEFPGDAVFTDSSGKCPEDLIPLFPGLAADPDSKHRCIPAPRIRIRIEDENLRKGPLAVELGDGLGNERIQVMEEEISDYYPFDIMQSGTPITVRLVQNGLVLWEEMVVFRVKHAYTLEYDPSQKEPVSIILDD
jgi:hypothetical protein